MSIIKIVHQGQITFVIFSKWSFVWVEKKATNDTLTKTTAPIRSPDQSPCLSSEKNIFHFCFIQLVEKIPHFSNSSYFRQIMDWSPINSVPSTMQSLTKLIFDTTAPCSYSQWISSLQQQLQRQWQSNSLSSLVLLPWSKSCFF